MKTYENFKKTYENFNVKVNQKFNCLDEQIKNLPIIAYSKHRKNLELLNYDQITYL